MHGGGGAELSEQAAEQVEQAPLLTDGAEGGAVVEGGHRLRVDGLRVLEKPLRLHQEVNGVRHLPRLRRLSELLRDVPGLYVATKSVLRHTELARNGAVAVAVGDERVIDLGALVVIADGASTSHQSSHLSPVGGLPRPNHPPATMTTP